ncbi:hypothetical protein QFZ75_008010 [Streptomyces sp. V3I8]|uniref:hypothetical protein n=1 Tax=Streptomyces sp. V3I8 TaxID=3042279 RepID=UPI002783B278|nr:hypothetical protein [Streptomyces sp. V3I8]MDQ1041508.1 hypothetical protein [Streptomyces sp. V3I8]
MRVTAAKIRQATAHIEEATGGGYKSLTGGSNTGRTGTTFSANFETRIFDSARGENRQALAFFLGVMQEFGILTDEWAEVRADLAIGFADTQTWFERGQYDAQKQKTVIARKARAAAEADKEAIRDKARPIEERRAAFRRHNRRTGSAAPRSVESSSQDLDDETGYNGTNWPTHTIDVWINNDHKVYEDAVNHSRVSADSLRDYVEKVLFDLYALPVDVRKRLTQTDAHGHANVRSSLAREDDATDPREAFTRVDWEYVRSSLLGE